MWERDETGLGSLYSGFQGPVLKCRECTDDIVGELERAHLIVIEASTAEGAIGVLHAGRQVDAIVTKPYQARRFVEIVRQLVGD